MVENQVFGRAGGVKYNKNDRYTVEKYFFHSVNLGQNKEEHYEEERKKRSRSGYDAGSHHDFRANSFRNR